MTDYAQRARKDPCLVVDLERGRRTWTLKLDWLDLDCDS